MSRFVDFFPWLYVLLAVFAMRLLAVFTGRLALASYMLPGFVFPDGCWLGLLRDVSLGLLDVFC